MQSKYTTHPGGWYGRTIVLRFLMGPLESFYIIFLITRVALFAEQVSPQREPPAKARNPNSAGIRKVDF